MKQQKMQIAVKPGTTGKSFMAFFAEVEVIDGEVKITYPNFYYLYNKAGEAALSCCQLSKTDPAEFWPWPEEAGPQAMAENDRVARELVLGGSDGL